MDMNGTIIIHPDKSLEGLNILGNSDAGGREYIKEMLDTGEGRMIYPGETPGTGKQNSLAYYSTLPDLKWVIVSVSSFSDMYAMLGSTRNLSLILALAAFIAINLIVSMFFVRLLRPIRRLNTSLKPFHGAI